MRLLVSVRSPEEVEAALGGGADIIDAKDPAKAALGRVTTNDLVAIDRCVPLEVPFSLALGDAQSPDAIHAEISALGLRDREAVYVKAGLLRAEPVPPVDFPDRASVIRAAVSACARHPARPRFVAVVYADRLAPATAFELLGECGRAGIAAVLLDTAAKDGRSLLGYWPEPLLRTWVQEARSAGLEVALAGSLTLRDLGRVAAVEPDIIGVRGAACAGGRLGWVDAGRVFAIKSLLPPEPATNAAKHEPSSGPLSAASILK